MPKNKNKQKHYYDGSSGKHKKWGQPGAFGKPRHLRTEETIEQQAHRKAERRRYNVLLNKLKKLTGMVR